MTPTKNDVVALHASPMDMATMLIRLLAHLMVTLVGLYIISEFVLNISFAVGVGSAILFADVMLAYTVWWVLGWSWRRTTINDKKYRFTGTLPQMFLIILAVTSLLIIVEVALGASILMGLNANYEWWHVAGMVLLFIGTVMILVRATIYMKKWVHRHVVPA